MLHAACCMLHAACFMLHAAWFMLHATCFVWRAACCTLTTLRGTLHVRAQVWHMYVHGPAFEEVLACPRLLPTATHALAALAGPIVGPAWAPQPRL